MSTTPLCVCLFEEGFLQNGKEQQNLENTNIHVDNDPQVIASSKKVDISFSREFMGIMCRKQTYPWAPDIFGACIDQVEEFIQGPL